MKLTQEQVDKMLEMVDRMSPSTTLEGFRARFIELFNAEVGFDIITRRYSFHEDQLENLALELFRKVVDAK